MIPTRAFHNFLVGGREICAEVIAFRMRAPRGSHTNRQGALARIVRFVPSAEGDIAGIRFDEHLAERA